MDVRELTLQEWESVLPDDGFEVFHLPAALEVLDRYEPGELRLLGACRDDHLVGLLPVFVRRKWIAKAIVSPPPGMFVPRLGPLFLANGAKQGRREALHRAFVDEMTDILGTDGVLTLVGVACTDEYTDPRPYAWADFEVDTRFSYVLGLADTSPDDVLASFSKSLRRDIRDAADTDVTVETDGIDAARRIYDATERHYEQQGKHLPIRWEYTRDLVSALDDRARVYTATDPSGAFLSGIVVLYSNDSAYFWLGGTRADYEGASVNSLLHWRIIEDAMTDDDLPPVHRYELGNADNERLARYKSKFNPELVPSYTVQSGRLASLAQEVYSTVVQ